MAETTEVPFGDKPDETATLLLAAAEETGHDQSVVTVSGKHFVVPQEVHDKAFGKSGAGKGAAKKTAAKKATAKKAAAKKSASAKDKE